MLGNIVFELSTAVGCNGTVNVHSWPSEVSWCGFNKNYDFKRFFLKCSM